MRKLIYCIAALIAGMVGARLVGADDLEVLDPQIAQAFAQVLGEAADKIESPAIKVEGDNEKCCGVHLDQIGLILVPQKDLKQDEIPEAIDSDPGAPLAHLFMSEGFTPVVDGKPLPKSKLRSLEVIGQDGSPQNVSYLALAARHTDDDVWHLYGYGTDEKPVLDVQIGEGFGPGTMPLALEVNGFDDNKGMCIVTIYDMYQGSFPLAYTTEGEAATEEASETKSEDSAAK